MIISVDLANLSEAAAVHAVSWQDSHRSFCSPDFVALHSPEHQAEYLRQKLSRGSRIWMLVENGPVGIVSVTGSLIEDLYVLPEHRSHGCGALLLQHALRQCEGRPVLWILENNTGAARFYRRAGFTETGRRNNITEGLDEIEFTLENF